MADDLVSDHPDGATLRLRVSPRSSDTGFDGLRGDALRLRVTAPPVDDRANEEIRRFLADRLGVARTDIEILSGARIRDKTVLVRGVPAGALRAVLAREVTRGA